MNNEVEIARNVLFFFGDRELGWEPGGFTTKLISAICAADSMNRARLRLAFPALVQFVTVATDREDGLAELRDFVRSAQS